MSAEKPHGNAWRQVMRLGEEIIALGQKVRQAENIPADPTTDASYPKEMGRFRLVAQAIARASQAQNELIRRTTEQILGGKARLWLADWTGLGDGTNPSQTAGRQDLPPLMEQALLTGHICTGDTQEAQSERRAKRKPHALAAPLVIQSGDSREQGSINGEPIGVLMVERLEGPPFSQEEIELLDGLAEASAIAIQSDRLSAVEAWRMAQLSLVRQVSIQIANVRDLNELSRRVTRLILETFDYYYVAIFTLEQGNDTLHFRASAGPADAGVEQPGEMPASLALTIRIGQGMIGQTAESGHEMIANEVEHNPEFKYSEYLPETQAEAVLPLKIEDHIVGVLDVQSNQANDFHATDLLVLRTLAGSVAVAVEGARLYSALRQRAEQLSSVYEVSSAITSILDTEALLDEVVSLIHKRFGYPFVHLFSVHPGRRKIFYEAGSGERNLALKDQRFAYDLDDPEGIIPWVGRNGETVLANNVELEPRYKSSALPPEITRAELTTPLIFGGAILGVLDIQSNQANAFREEDRFLFEALADSIAIAMRNANLYRSEVWRRQVADSFLSVAGLLSAGLDLDQVLEAVLTELERNLPCDVAAIWLLDENNNNEEGDEEANESPAYLRLAAVRGPFAGRVEVGLRPEDVVPSQETAVIERLPQTGAEGQDASWLAQALHSDQPITRNPGDPFDPLGAVLEFGANYSAVATPLMVRDQHLGVLTLAHHEAGRYGTEARAMTAAFASYAAIAIENTRLYEAAHEQAWVATVLLQVAEATQSLTNLNELLETVVRITPMLVGVRACMVYIMDEEESFVPAAVSGLTREQQAEFERWRFAPGEVPALDDLLINRHPLLLSGEQSSRRLAEIVAGDESEEGELLVLVPMLSRDELLGAFLIDYSSQYMDVPQDLEAFFDEQLPILQGIAHQTAIAVENIRLLKSQKEEAYVSVALLQVAQAIVSLNNLDDILGTVVRTTPILVGVKRALMYLWDGERQVFQLAQSYGAPRNAEARSFHSHEFPLLDAVMESGSILALPIGDEDGEEEAFESWIRQQPPEPDEVEDYLESEACLLLAFPLAAHGESLGVFLVEEPDISPLENQALSSNRRLRAKRLEITTGICQQATLAIKNDRLQRETVLRERLEREVQLARDIQRTFLPKELPSLPGWEVSARWITARQVGGDFYDVFELPDGRIGLAIADVADKGMPAALFMVLVRTLLRAAAPRLESPAESLRRVNELLAPDAPDGMFVTLFYGVLDPATGDLCYANAGHNPPFIVHRREEVERLPNGNIALGVLQDAQFEEFRITLAPEDLFLLYTDGFIEAFSPYGDMFGEERLRQALVEAAQSSKCSAEDALRIVIDVVTDFLEGDLPADDQTALMLRRDPEC